MKVEKIIGCLSKTKWMEFSKTNEVKMKDTKDLESFRIDLIYFGDTNLLNKN